MRISDWSSDLCSSDLAILIGGGVALILAALLAVFLTVSLERRRKAEQRLVAVEALRETERRLADIAKNFPGIIYQRVLHPDGRVSFPYLSDRAMQLIGLDPDSVKDPMPLGTFSSRQIGRASCRERVCQYV